MARSSAHHAAKSPGVALWVWLTLISVLVVVGAIAVIWFTQIRPLNPGFVEPLVASEQSDSAGGAVQSDPEPTPQSEPETQPESVQFTIVAGGDILTHTPVLESAWNGDHYDLSELMTPVAPYIQGADLALCHMEVPLAAPGEAPTGFPVFAAPYETVQELKEAGWDGCSTGSNHSIDQGYVGLERTLNAFDEAGMGHTGTARSYEEAALPQMYQIEKDGQTLTVAHIAFANNLNGLDFPAEQPWAINLNDVQAVLDQAAKAREAGADLVIVSYHCCEAEYVSDPEPLQVETANTLAASGLVDIMISHHAHVPKPMTWLEGGPNGNGMWVTYGTGNFISNQDENCCVPQSSTGIISFFDVEKAPDGTVTVPDASWSAIHSERLNGHYVRVVTAEGAEGSPVPTEDSQWRHQMTQDVVGTSPAHERTEPPSDPGTLTVVPRSY